MPRKKKLVAHQKPPCCSPQGRDLLTKSSTAQRGNLSGLQRRST